MKRLTARVYGRVQGVNFRYYTRQKATNLNLTGWTRNEADGTVTVVAEGPSNRLHLLLEFLRHGPPAARVDSVDFDWSNASREFNGFGVRWK